ncbi:hypothetical protein FRC12_006056 [Ceratobasidium sp. 428]|nr:hypothetical protein FRC12_006056 [Ceratobasidium sp. 428]
MVEEVGFRDHDLLEQIRLLSASSENRMRQALTQTLRGLWISLPFSSTISRFDNSTVLALLEQLQRFDTKLMNDDERRQVALFQAIHAQDTDKLLLMAEENVVASRLCGALLCFSHCARDLIPSQDATISTFLSKSSLALNYYDKLATLAQDIRPSSVDIQRLLGFEPAQPDTNAGSDSIEGDSSVTSKFRLFSTSPMFERAKSMIGTLEEIPCALELTAVTISESDIDILATCTISAALRCEVQAMHAVASVARCTEPCLGSAVFGVCRLEKCGRLDVDCYQIPNNTRQTQFHEVLRAHLLQILIIDSSESTLEERRTWIQKLYEILTPCFAPLGNAPCVEHMRIPELDRGLKVVSAWCDRNLDELRPGFTNSQSGLCQTFLCLLNLHFGRIDMTLSLMPRVYNARYSPTMILSYG